MRLIIEPRSTGPLVLTILLSAALPLAGQGQVPAAALPKPLPSDSVVLSSLRANAIPLATTSPDSGLADLAALRQVVGDARIVLLGQATHGTREFFQLGHQMIKYLVTEMGFSTLMIEAFWSRGLPVNDFLRSGEGSADSALAQLGMWIWDTEEIRDLLRWVREYNQGVAEQRRVRFYGLDMQDGWSSMRGVVEYLREVDPEYASQVAVKLTALDSIQASYDLVRGYGKRPPALLRDMSATIDGISTRLDNRRDNYVRRSSSERWTIARQHATILAQAHESWSLPDWPNVGDLRDRFMADNAASLLQQAGRDAKVIIWAHNAHVARGLWNDRRALGWHLAQRHGSAMVVFGFGFNQGSLQAWDRQGSAVVEHTVEPAPEATVSGTLAAVGLPLFFIDLRRASEAGPLAAWLSSRHPERTFGSGINSGDTPAQIVPREVYDAIVFVDRTTRARPTPTGRRPRSP